MFGLSPTLIPLANQSHVLGSRDSINVSRFGKHAAFLLKRFQVSMAVHLRRIGIKACDEFPVLFGSQVLLAFDYNDLVGPYRLL